MKQRWTGYKFPKGQMNPTPEGKKLLSMEVGQWITIPYSDERRPSGPAEIVLLGKHYKMEPEKDGVRCTRIK